LNRPRIVIAEDHPSTQEVLRQMLAPGYDIVAVVGDGEAAVQAAESQQPDVLLLDISLPFLSGIAVARRVKRDFPEMRIVFVTAHAERAYQREAFRAGANGYVVKRALVAELAPSLEAALNGQTYRSPSVAN
jgi:DNA-binding NarL/FixJ family response regulator